MGSDGGGLRRLYGYRIPDDAIVGIRTRDPTAVLYEQDLLHNKIQLNDVASRHSIGDNERNRFFT